MDETKPQNPRPRPANTNKGADVSVRRKPTSPLKPSKESQFVGYLVLGFGILAVIAVLIVAAKKFGNTPQPQQATQTQPSQPVPTLPPENTKETQKRIAQDLLTTMNTAPEKPKAQPKIAPKKDLYFSRQPGLKPESITGAWQALIGQSTAVLQMNGGTYQIVLADPKEYSRRLYSSGTYTILDDMILLNPRMDWSAPTPPVGTDVFYQSITTAPFPVMVGMKGGRMLWQNPPSTETRVYVPRAMPLMQDRSQGFITWQRVK